MNARVPTVLSALCLVVACAPLAAQCTNTLSPLGPASVTNVRTLASLPSGLVAGLFADPMGIALWNGVAWTPFGGGIQGNVNALTVLPGGDLVAGGAFWSAGGAAINNVARWNGTSWSSFGAWPSVPYALATLPNGTLVAGGYQGVQYWTGSSWQLLGGPAGPDSNNGAVWAFTTLPNGDLIAGGNFFLIGGAPPYPHNVARWNGTSWSTIGPGQLGPVNALATLANGDLIAAGTIHLSASNACVMRWTGSVWTSLGPLFATDGAVLSLHALPDGDLIAGGTFTVIGGVSANGIARWNGTSWSAVATGVTGVVRAMAETSNGDAVAGGNITAVGLSPATVAVVSTTCPATSAPSGFGCPSSGGTNTLVADVPPWVDATFRATGSGLPTNAIVITLTSVTSILQGAAPLTSVFPQAGPGCDALVAPDILGVLVTTTGTAQSSFFLPNTPPLVGVTFYHQMIPIEVDALGNWVSVTATNALQLTAGVF